VVVTGAAYLGRFIVDGRFAVKFISTSATPYAALRIQRREIRESAAGRC
jgi:hypothetical protein